MKREDIDWKVLRGALSVFVISIVLTSALVGGSIYFRDEMKKDFRRHNAQFKSISQRYLAIDEEEKLIKKYYPVFLELYNKGVIGREKRLNWIEVLRKAGQEIKLSGLNYQIKSQNNYTPNYSLVLGRYNLFSSTMSLKIQLLHEGDLFDLLDALNEKADGRYSVSKCSFAGTAKIVTNESGAVNINADCDLQWFTIKLANGAELQI